MEAFVRLLNEGTDVYRPVQIEPIGDGLFRIVGPDQPDDEEWEVACGDIVKLIHIQTNDEDQLKLAVPQS